MNYCFCCEFAEVDNEDESCSRCVKLLRHPFFGLRLLRGAVTAKLRGSMLPKDADKEIQKFMSIITDSTNSR